MNLTHKSKLSLFLIISYLLIELLVIIRDKGFGLVGRPIGLIQNQQPTLVGAIIYFIYAVVLAILPLLIIKHWRSIKFHLRLRHDINWLSLVPLFLTFAWAFKGQITDTFVNLPSMDLSKIVYNILMGSQPGFFEEFLVRGTLLLLLITLLNTGQHKAFTGALISSILFGLLHLINLFGGEQGGLETLQQTLYAIVLGLIFTVMYYRTGSLWVPIFWHALLDTTYNFSSSGGAGSWVELVVAFLPVFVVTIWMLRPSMNSFNLAPFQLDSGVNK